MRACRPNKGSKCCAGDRGAAARTGDELAAVEALLAGARAGRGGALLLEASPAAHPHAVTAKLALRLPKSLAGETLSVDVAATDAKGRTQVEPAAALITVTS